MMRCSPMVLLGLMLLSLGTLIETSLADSSSSGTLTVTGGLTPTDSFSVVDGNGNTITNPSIAFSGSPGGTSSTLVLLSSSRQLRIQVATTTSAQRTVTLSIADGKWRKTDDPTVTFSATGTQATGISVAAGYATANLGSYVDFHNTSLCAGHTAGSNWSSLASPVTIHILQQYSNGCTTQVLSGAYLKAFVPLTAPIGEYEASLVFTMS